jgi:acetyl-CoA C-acetyltransferase
VHDVVILSAVRTPIGKLGGALAEVRPDDLAAVAVAAAVSRSGVAPSEIDEVFLGCTNQSGEDGRNVARMAALLAGLPESVAAVTINRLCASGLSAVNQAARALRCGEADVVVAGGVESMSRAPYAIARHGPRAGNLTAWDTAMGWRFPNPRLEQRFPLETMGETAENIAALSCRSGVEGGEISREEQDRFALQSHRRAVDAMNAGRFDAELVPVEVPGRRGESHRVGSDEHAFSRRTGDGLELDTNLARLSRLRSAFREGGSVTAGNASSLNDGASALVLTTSDRAQALGVTPLARWVGSAAAGVDPRLMGLGPVPAVRRLLARLDLEIDDIDLAEVNEAFAVQALAVVRELGLDEAVTNVNGGAIALGHPLGCSGARILTTLLHEMRRRTDQGAQVRYGLATLCVGVGQGEATVVELV